MAEEQVVGSLLLETRPDGTLAKLELAGAAGLLTLHPEAATLHGNIVRPAGIEHLALPWDDDCLLLVVGTPTTAAAAAARLADRIGVGEGHTVAVVSADVGFTVERQTYRVIRSSETRWRFIPAHGGPGVAVTLDADGIPILDDAETWPLEVGAAR